jgi:hypothetical protein
VRLFIRQRVQLVREELGVNKKMKGDGIVEGASVEHKWWREKVNGVGLRAGQARG